MAKLPDLSTSTWSTSRGGLLSDLNPEKMPDGALFLTIPESGALNVRSTGAGTNQSPDYALILGNDDVYFPDAVAAQNRIYRIDLSYQPNVQYVFRVSDPSGTTENTVFITSGANLTDTYTNIATAFAAMVNFNLTIGSLNVISTTTGYFTAQVINVPYWDYVIESLGTETGQDYVTNGTFTGSAAGWTLGAGWTWAANKVTHTTPLSLNPFYQIINSISDNQFLRVQLTTSASTTGSVDVSYGGTFIFALGGNGTANFDFNANANGDDKLSFKDSGFGFDGSVDDISLVSPLKATITLIQEAYDPSVVGDWHEIGDDDRTGDLFQLWTTRVTLPETLTVLLTDNGSGVYRVTTPVPYNWGQNFAVEIKGTADADGVWIINVISATQFDLLGSTYIANSSGTVTSYIYGLGEIGVGVKDENSQTWTYTTLLRSKEFNFTTVHQIDSRVKRKNDLNKADYFTDDFNPPRVFYYKGAYIPNGALKINGGIYEYGTIDTELRLFVQSLLTIRFVNQIQTGGGLTSGNKRYAVRGLTDKLSPSTWSFLTNPVPTTTSSENTGTPRAFFGNLNFIATGKQNVLEIGVPFDGIFKYAEIAVVNYWDNSFTGEIIGRYLLTGGDQQVIHTGFETGQTDLDIGTLNDVENIVKTARGIELSQNRAILSCLTINNVQVDLSAWFATWTYTVSRRTLEAGGSYINNTLQVGEYQLSQNVYNYASLMLNERYRFGAIVTYKGGGKSPVFFIDDVVIDTTTAGRKTGLPSFDLTTNLLGLPQPYSFYIAWTGYDVNFSINGKPVKDYIEDIEIVRCIVENPQVLASGFVIPAVGGQASSGEPLLGTQTLRWTDSGNTVQDFGEFPLNAGYSDDTAAGSPLPHDYGYGDTSALVNFSVQRHWASFYWIGNYLGQEDISFIPGDKILNFGQPNSTRLDYTNAILHDYIGEFNGNTGLSSVQIITLDDGVHIGKGEQGIVAAQTYSKRLYFDYSNPATPLIYEAPKGLVIHSATDFFDKRSANSERAFYIAQYFRAIATGDEQYGTKDISKYVTTGSHLQITDNTPSTFDTFGGDVFTQRGWLKNRYPTDISVVGFGQAFGFYSQNRVNAQMKGGTYPAGGGAAFPNYPAAAPQPYLNEVAVEVLTYNHGYDIRNGVTLYAAFDVNAEQQKDWRNAFIWSGEESDGTVTDNLRQFSPLNIVFEDYTNGEITELRDFKGNILVMQPLNTHIRLYNPNNLITSSEGSQVILGVDANVFSQKPIPVSNFGCSNKWSVCEGLSDKGQRIIYYWDLINKAVVRIGYDGNNALEEIHGIKSFIADNTQFLIGKDSPKHNEGISVVPNQRYREIIWACRGYYKGVDAWVSDAGYVTGAVVSYGTLEFDDIPQFYVAIDTDHTPLLPPSINSSWAKILKSDNRYYNVYTIVWDELKNVFQSFHSYNPKVLVKYRNTFLSTKNISDTGVMYEHDKGLLCSWYDDGSTVLQKDGYFDGVVAQPEDISKYYMATAYMSLLPPSEVDYTTLTKKSYLVASNFKVEEDTYFSTIKNDSTVSANNISGINSARTSRIYGKYLIVRSWMSRIQYNAISSFTIKWRKSERTPYS